MRAVWAVLAAIFCGAASYIVTAMAAFLVLDVPSGDSGGTAMGIMFSIAPIGAVAGAIAGVVFALSRGRKAKTLSCSGGLEEKAGGAAGSKPVPSRGVDYQAIIAVGAVAAIVAGLYYALFYEYVPPQFSAERRPMLMFEIKVPNAAVAEDDYFQVKARLRSWQHTFDPMGGLKRRQEGNAMVFYGTVPMYNKVSDRKFWLWLSEKSFVEFNLPIDAAPHAQADFSDWRDADNIEIYASYQKVYPLKNAEAKIRTRVVWPE
jgi:MFS family permease